VRVGIVGAGALGTLFGFALASRHDVYFLDVRPDVIEAVERVCPTV